MIEHTLEYAWCVDCCRNGFRTLKMRAGLVQDHLMHMHGPDDVVQIQMGSEE